MKNKTKFILLSFTLIITASLVSCMSKSVYTKEAAEEPNQEKDAQFLVNAAEINMTAISLGELAEEKGSTDYIQSLGKMMRENHQTSLDRLTILAGKKDITLPAAMTSSGNEYYTQLNNKSGGEFDKDYADLMVTQHENAITLFEKAASKSKDNDIRDWAKSEIPVLQNHLKESVNCQKKCAVL